MPVLRILEADILQASKLDYFKHFIFFLSQLKQIINLVSWNIFHLLPISALTTVHKHQFPSLFLYWKKPFLLVWIFLTSVNTVWLLAILRYPSWPLRQSFLADQSYFSNFVEFLLAPNILFEMIMKSGLETFPASHFYLPQCKAISKTGPAHLLGLCEKWVNIT